jgi:cytochrome c oxidase subunit 3
MVRDAIPLSRFCLWLFLSTEVMFFVALIGSYVVLRSGVPRGQWPSQATVGIVPWIGAVNTAVLLSSSILIGWAVAHAVSNRPAAATRSLAAAVLLGAIFLGIKSYEYWEKYRMGLFPRSSASLIHPRADTEYLSAVQVELERVRAGWERPPKDLDPTASERLALLEEIRLGLVLWTSREVGTSDDPDERESAIQAMAHAIRPTSDEPSDWTDDCDRQLQELQLRRTQLEADKQRIESELAAAVERLSPPNDSPAASEAQGESEVPAPDSRAALAQVNTELGVVQDRLKILKRLSALPAGLNEGYGLRLPIVVPGGRTWLNGYYLLSGMHAIHLLAAVAAAAVLLPLKLDAGRALLLGNIALYWHFVDAVWLVLFPILYLW